MTPLNVRAGERFIWQDTEGDTLYIVQEGSCVVIVEKDAIKGIVSERDIVRAVARHGGAGLAMSAAEWMTAKVVTCKPADTINDVMQKMTSGRFRHLPVVENGKLAGIISIGDVVKKRIEDVEREADQIREYIATA